MSRPVSLSAHPHNVYFFNYLFGMVFLAEQCHNRYDYLKKKYNFIKRSMRSGDATPTWLYFQEFEIHLGQKPSIQPVYHIDSLANSGESGSIEFLDLIEG